MLNPAQQVLMDQWKDVPIGTPVAFRSHSDRPDEILTKTISDPFEASWVACIRLEGAAGDVLLEYVRKIG